MKECRTAVWCELRLNQVLIIIDCRNQNLYLTLLERFSINRPLKVILNLNLTSNQNAKHIEHPYDRADTFRL